MGGEQSQQAIQYGPQQHDRPIDLVNSLTGPGQVPPGTQIVGTRSNPGALPHIADGTYTPPTFNERALSAQRARELSAQQAQWDQARVAQRAQLNQARTAQRHKLAQAKAAQQAHFHQREKARARELLELKAQIAQRKANVGGYNSPSFNAGGYMSPPLNGGGYNTSLFQGMSPPLNIMSPSVNAGGYSPFPAVNADGTFNAGGYFG